jgi:hypothetical protein
MPTAITTTSSVADSLPTMVASARKIREYGRVMTNLVDTKTLGVGMGLNWDEVSYAKLTAQAISETQEYDNPQEITDAILTITPTVIGIETIVTDRTKLRISPNALAEQSGLSQTAIERKRDIDLLSIFAGATTTLAGTGTTATTGHISAATVRVQGNTTEPWDGPTAAVMHSFQVKDLFDEAVSGFGTYPFPAGLSSDILRGFWKGPISGTDIFIDDNISIDGTPDARGAIFARGVNGAIIHVRGRSPWMAVERKQIGGGAEAIFHYDEYANAERGGGVWLFGLLSDATVPTS